MHFLPGDLVELRWKDPGATRGIIVNISSDEMVACVLWAKKKKDWRAGLSTLSFLSKGEVSFIPMTMPFGSLFYTHYKYGANKDDKDVQ